MGEEKKNEQKYFILKTEASEWSWKDQESKKGISKWDGVKNKQAQKYMKSMSLNDLCFFYHSGPKARRIVGVVKVIREWYEEGKEGAVDVKAVGEMRRPVDLKEMKIINGFILLKQPRLSVVPVTENIWKQICDMGGGYEGDGNDEEDEEEEQE
ncbi:unnamed protein product [Lupinus luteus]|uniref:EVE domain-containing protein n=1 Tax=Lupinus luteus TaxID=3873 RepID=A0AAV1WLH6_LUPLU